MPKTTTSKAAASAKPLTAKSEVFSPITSPMPPPLSPPDDAPSPDSEVITTPKPESPVRVTFKIDIRKAAEGRKILADLTNANARFKARLAADPYPVSRMRSTANPKGFIDFKPDIRPKRPINTSVSPIETETDALVNRMDAMCKLESTDMAAAPAASNTGDVPAVTSAELPTTKNRHRISAVTRAVRRSMFKVSVAKRGRNAGKVTMAGKIALAKSFVSMHHLILADTQETTFECPRFELPAKQGLPAECLANVIYFAVQQHFIRANSEWSRTIPLGDGLTRSSI